MKYLTAQPDSPYFIWQLKVQMNNFRKFEIEQDAVIVFGVNKEPSEEAIRFSNQTKASVVFIPDKRTNYPYLSSIRPHILKYVDIFQDYDVMYHDSDIIFNRLPAIEETSNVLVSDTRSYIGAEYIRSKGEDIFFKMCEIVGILPQDVISREKQSGGAQYYFPKKTLPRGFWHKVERDCIELYTYLNSASVQRRDNAIQAWTADMWAVLWNVWLAGAHTEISPELDFCWPMDPIDQANVKPIFHLAGITEKDRGKHFYKGDFIKKSPFGAELNYTEGFCDNKYISELREAEQIFE